MRKFMIALLALTFYALPAFAQHEVPQAEVEALAKPFLGTYDAVACDPRPHGPDGSTRPYGIKFSVRVEKVADVNAGPNAAKLAPVFRLLGIEPVDGAKVTPFDFDTIGFFHIKGTTADEDHIWFDTRNANLVVRVEPSAPNARQSIVTKLDGIVMVINDGTRFSFYAIPAGDANSKVDPWDYVKPLSQVCPVVENDDSQNDARLLRASL